MSHRTAATTITEPQIGSGVEDSSSRGTVPGGTLRDWLDARTGYRKGLKILFGRELPSGPKWIYSLASCLLWLFVVQIATGFLLMTTYSPSLSTAWASVHFIERDAAGAFLRGVHHFTAQAMIVLLFVHLIRVLLSGAFRAPRELVWITGLLLIPLVLVWALTGNPLPGSQRGMSQIDVEGNIIGTTPVIGSFLQQLLIGGDRVGNLTLTHLYFLHVALLPFLGTILIVAHIWQVYRHGLSGEPAAGKSAKPVPYWPHQSVRNMIVLTVVLGTIAVLAWKVGAPLEVPADPAIEHSPRPEWYFLSLFELRRYFKGSWEVVATVVIPVAVLLFLICIPWIDSVCSRRISRTFRYGVVAVCCGVWGWLTISSVARDRADADYQASEAHLAALSERARELADGQGIPVEGAVSLLRNDAKTQGPILFARHCSSCHSHSPADGEGIIAEDPSAPNLFGFGSREWITGVFDPEKIAGDHYFGNTAAAEGDMVYFVQDAFESAEDDEARGLLKQQFDDVATALAAEAGLSGHSFEQDRVAEGVRLMTEELGCTDCHRFREEGDLGYGPDLTGYGSREWLLGMIADPNGERFYPDDRNDRMPAFHPNPHDPGSNLLTRRELEMLVEWLRGEWYRPDRAVAVEYSDSR
jgi:ubiquinol-cytochrome c reductase cytochrome b subunit